MKDIKWIMFDADNTLLDFNKASKDALWKLFEDHGSACNEEIYSIYKKINYKVWTQFEEGVLSAVDLRPKRFKDLFDELGYQLTSPLKASQQYLNNLVVCSEMYADIPELLGMLKRKYKLSLITNGLKEVQRPRLQRLNLTHYFDSIVVSDEIGFAKPDSAFFNVAFSSFAHQLEKEEVLVVGDNIVADVKGGQDFGCATCWISHGKEKSEHIIPDHTIHDISEFHTLV